MSAPFTCPSRFRSATQLGFGFQNTYGSEAMPLAVTVRFSVPSGRPAGSVICVLTTVEPVCTPVELQLSVRAYHTLAPVIGVKRTTG